MASEFKNYSFDNDNIAARLFRYRTKSGLTRDDVIANAGTSMSKSTLQGWEGAKREASLTGDSAYQRQKKRVLYQRWAAIKSDRSFEARFSIAEKVRNQGDAVKLLMAAACA